jgi:type I restriction enzyme S subunit
MGDMVQIISGTSYSKDDLDEQDIRIIRGGNIDDEVNRLLLLDDDTYVSARLYDNEKEPISGDIIIVGSTGSKKVIGKPAFIDRTYENVQIGAFLRIIRPTSRLLFDYLKIIFSSEHYRKHIRSLAQVQISTILRPHITEFIIPFTTTYRTK